MTELMMNWCRINECLWYEMWFLTIKPISVSSTAISQREKQL